MKRANGTGSIYYDRRRQCYIVRVTVGRDALTGAPIRRQRSVHRKSDTHAALRALQKSAGKIELRAVPLARYVRHYVETFKKPHVRENTWQNYLAVLSRIDARFGMLPVKDLTPILLQSVLNSEKSRHTAHRIIVLIRAAIHQAIAERLIDHDPTAGVRAPTPPGRKQISIIAPRDAARLVRAAMHPAVRIAIQLQYATGMRAEEALGLTWEDIDFERRTLTITRVTNQIRGGVRIAPPKSAAAYRTITLPPRLVQDLAAYRAWQDTCRVTPFRPWVSHPAGSFVCTATGAPVGIHTYASAFRYAARRAHVRVTPHGLRHTHATELVAAGWSPKDVQARLGHASVRITLDTYTHPNHGNGEAIAAFLDTIYPSVGLSPDPNRR